MRDISLALSTDEAASCADMTISKNEWTEIRRTIENSFKKSADQFRSDMIEALRGEINSFRPHGWRRLATVLRELAPLGISVTLIVALLGITATAVYQANNRVSENAQFQQKTSDRLDQIEKDIHGLQAQASLAPISSELQFSKNSTVLKPKPEEIAKLSKQLLPIQDKFGDIPAVWQPTGEFINFKSRASQSEVHPASQNAFSVDCRAKGGNMTVNNGELTFNNCEIGLSSRLAGGPGLLKIVFINCVIDYEGGPVPTSPMSFEDCIFQFNVPVVPPPRGVQTMRLLAQSPSIQSVRIPGQPATHS
jgi:predicted transcriptional regulator